MSKYTLAILICGLLITLLDSKALLSPIEETKKFVISLLKFLLLGAIFIITVWKEDEDATEKKKIASAYVDSLKKFSNAHSDSLRNYGKAYSDSLKSFSTVNADSIKNYSSNLIKLLGKYQLQYDSATKQIFKRIDTTKIKQEPFITYALTNDEYKMHHKQSHDTCFFYPSIYNAGNSVAQSVNYTAYFVCSINMRDYEHRLQRIIKVDVPEHATNYTIGDNVFISGFKFDSTNNLQFVLITGSYSNSDGLIKDFKIAYQWNSGNYMWGNCSNADFIEKAHNNPYIQKF